MVETVRKCLLMVPRRWRRWWLLMPVMAMVGAALESGAAASVFLMVQVLQHPAEAATVPVIAWLVPHFPWTGTTAVVLQVTAVLALYILFKNLTLVGIHYLRHRIEGQTSAELASGMLRGYLLMPYPFHFRRNSAELIRSATGSIRAVTGTLDALNTIVQEALIGIGIVVVLMVAAPAISLTVGVALALLVVLLLKLTRSIANRSGRQQHALNKDLYQTLQNALGGIKEIKALGREDYFYRAFAETQRARLSLGYLGITLGTVPQLVIETAFVLGALLVVALITLQGAAGAEVLPLVGLFAYAGFRLIPVVHRLTWRLNEVRGSHPAVHDLYEDFLLVTRDEEPGPGTDPAALHFRDRLCLEDVSYTYPGADRPALQAVTLTLRQGESVGIVGPTGAGKSTLVDLVAGLLPPGEGRLTVDGQPLAGRERAWRRHIGYVPQQIFLLDDSMRRNIAMGVPAAEVDEEAVRTAVRLARLEELVAAAADGLDTMLGERGIRLSGGERQRIGIARALYHDPDVLIFDEATSALDDATEAEVSRAIDGLHGRKTMMIIAHRPSSVRHCDRLYLVEQGRVAAAGTIDEVAAGAGRPG